MSEDDVPSDPELDWEEDDIAMDSPTNISLAIQPDN